MSRYVCGTWRVSRSTTTCELRRTDAADGRLNARTDADRFGRSGPPGPPMGGRAPGRAKTLAFLAKLPSTVLFFRSPGGLSPKPRVAIFFIGEGGGEEPTADVDAVGAGARRPANDETLSMDSCESRAGGIFAQQRAATAAIDASCFDGESDAGDDGRDLSAREAQS